MSTASGDAAQDLSLTAPTAKGPPRVSPTRSGLSLGDLSSVDDGHDGAPPTASQSSSRHVELQLQRNLRKQQEHFVRQRQLFADLREENDARADDTAVSPSVLSSSSSSHGDSNADAAENCARKEPPTQPRQERESMRKDRAQRGRESAGGARRAAGADSLDCDKVALCELSRIKAKATSDYERRMAETQQKQARRLRPMATDVGKELSQQEASNEALRKQLELLRRLQVENNRFRHDNRVCRERNDALEAQNQSQRRELTRIRDHVADLTAQVEQDRQGLAAAAQTSRRLKSCEKQLSAARGEVERLQAALQEALEIQERSHAKAASDMGDFASETKRLKRSLKQAKQREASDAHESELLRSTVETLENELRHTKRELDARTRDRTTLSTQLAERSSQCEAIEASATACVQRMEAGMEALQKAFDGERERRKKLEAQRSSLQADLEAQRSLFQAELDTQNGSFQAELETQHSSFRAELEAQRGSADAHIEKLEIDTERKQQQLDACEHRIAQLQARLKDKKVALVQQHERYDEHVNELLATQRQDRTTITELRHAWESAEQHSESERAAAQEATQHVDCELRRVRKELDGLRSYLETTSVQGDARSELVAVDSDSEKPADAAHSDVSPELQVLQGAVSALRTEAMSFVHAFQRARHIAGQQAKTLAAVQANVAELERRRSEDATKLTALREQRTVAEQARDIASNEKLEVLAWSQQTCERSEGLEEELRQCERVVQSLLQSLRRWRRDRQAHHSVPDGDRDDRDSDSGRPSSRRRKKSDKSERSGVPALHKLDREVQFVLSAHASLEHELDQAAHEHRERASEAQTVQRELAAKAHEAERVLAEVEALHVESTKEQKKRLDAATNELENEKRELAGELHAATAQLDAAVSDRARLEAVVARLDADIPVFTTVLRLFVLVVQPLVLQVSALQVQKRFLVRENAEYAQTQSQIECLGLVLDELVPMDGASGHRRTGERHRRFRRVVIAVFALNRFQRCGVLHQPESRDSAGDTQERLTTSSGSFGSCTSLKAPRQRRSGASSCRSARRPSASSLPTAIKVLAAWPTLSALDVRLVVERLRRGGVAESVAAVLALGGPAEASASVPFLGSALVQVLTAIDPNASETLLENTGGAFHCEALLEWRRRHRSSRRRELSASESDWESERSVVDRIRKRVLALGKRVEDLHFQRNALQTDSYELQAQLEHQATRLQHMEQLQHQTAELQNNIDELRAQSRRDHDAAQLRVDATQRELEAQASETRATQQELVHAHVQTESLRVEVTSCQEKLHAMDAEKQALRADVAKLTLASVEAEEKAEAAKAGALKQEEDVRDLKQAARQAHELYQKVSGQLEREVRVRASLQASVDLLTQQKESLESELHDAKLRDVETSFTSEGSEQPPVRTKAPLRVRFAACDHRDNEQSLQASSEAGSSPDSRGCSRHSVASERLSMEEDACLYHKYTTPSERVSSGVTHHERERDDSDADDERRARDLSDGHSPLSVRLETGSPQSSSASDANSKFLDEWRRLQLTAAFDGQDKSVSRRLRRTPEATATSTQAAVAAEIQNNRRRIEVDRMNSAVHDYMDRIDEKLHQMYGIPPSSSASASSSRSRSNAKHSSDGSDVDDDEKEEEEEEEEREGGSSDDRVHRIPMLTRRHGVKSDETREVQWFG